MRSYLGAQSSRDILHNSLLLYARNFAPLIAIYLLPTLPVRIWAGYLARTTGEVFNTAYYIGLIVEMIPMMAITVAVSEICMGNRPSVMRAYGRVLRRRPGKVFATYALFALGFALALLLLVIPALIFYAWYMFALIVVILEGSSVRVAFRRSRFLGRGWYWRNLGVVLLMLLVYVSVVLLIALPYDVLCLFEPQLTLPWAGAIIGGLAGSLLAPPVYVCVVLLYFDMKARKEAADNITLTEDLMR